MILPLVFLPTRKSIKKLIESVFASMKPLIKGEFKHCLAYLRNVVYSEVRLENFARIRSDLYQ